MAWLASALGAALVVVFVRDVFHTLWHPGAAAGSVAV